MKKILAIIFSLMLVLCMVACSSSSNSNNGNSNDNENTYDDNPYDDNPQVADDAILELMQDGETIIITLTGNIATVANEMAVNGEAMQLSIQFNGTDYELLGNFSLLCSEEGRVYESAWFDEGDLEVYSSYDNEKVVFFCSDCPIDFEQAESASVSILIDDEFLYQQDFDMQDVSFTEGEYEPEVDEDDFQFAEQKYVGFIFEDDTFASSEIVTADIEVTYNGYIVTCDYGSYEIIEEQKYNGDEPFIDVEVKEIDSENDSQYIDASVDHETGEIIIDVYEDSVPVCNMKFVALETLYQDTYTYDENGNIVEGAFKLSLDGNSVKFTILDKYETDWLELGVDVLNITLYDNSRIYLSGVDGTNLENGEDCTLYIYEASYSDEEDFTCSGMSYSVYDDMFKEISSGALINYVNIESDFFTQHIETEVIGSFTDDATGYTVKVNKDKITINAEESIELNIDLEKLIIYNLLDSSYPVYIDGELAYTFNMTSYEIDDEVIGDFSLNDKINDVYILSYSEYEFYKD